MPPKRRRFPALTNRIVGKTADGRNIYENELDDDGRASVSSERSTTFKVDGKFYNYPTIFDGKELHPDDVVEIFKQNKRVDPETGKQAKPFNSVKEAVKAAEERSHGLGNIQ